MTTNLPRALADCAGQMVHTAAAAQWRGPDPYDGLLHRWPAALRAGARRRQAIVQLHARAPIDLRRLYRRREQPRIAKALGLFGSAALRLDALRPDAEVRAAGERALRLLVEDDSAGEAWGYPFDVQTRWSFYPAGSANVVVTSFAACALDEAGRRWSERRFLERAGGAARWTLERTFDERLGAFCYHEHSDTVIHNANLLAARLVWRQLREDSAAAEAVRRAVERSLAAQSRDGAFRYGEGASLEWNDSFHTGFVLASLAEMIDVDSAVLDAVRRGASFYTERFFGPRGEARLWPGKRFPEDAHAAGTGLSTLASLNALDLADRALLSLVGERVVGSTVRDGHAVWRRNRIGSIRVPYIRWCDAHVALGLADAATRLTESS